MTLVAPASPYGFWIAKADGTQARNFTKIALPKELPEPTAEEVVQTYKMDQGLNHPGYRVTYNRPVDISDYDFVIKLGKVSSADMDWLVAQRDLGRPLLISWREGFRYLATFQKGGCKVNNYALNLRLFGNAELSFHIRGQSSTTFSL